MKYLIPFCFLITSCSILVANYDSNEYGLINKIKTYAQLHDCNKISINELYELSVELKNFSQYLPRNQESFDLVTKLNILIDQLHRKDNPSDFYCKEKLNIIAISAEEIQKVIGRKPK